jgi:hypothetical protein
MTRWPMMPFETVHVIKSYTEKTVCRVHKVDEVNFNWWLRGWDLQLIGQTMRQAAVVMLVTDNECLYGSDFLPLAKSTSTGPRSV